MPGRGCCFLVLQNLHCHTRFDDGADTPEAMVLAAEAAGLRSVGISLHCPLPGQEDWCCRTEYEGRFVEELHRLRELYAGRIAVWCGLEYDLEAARRTVPPYDYIIGSCHILNGFPIDNRLEEAEALIESFGGADRAAEAYYRRLCVLADYDEISIVGHFDLLTKFDERRPLYDPASPAYRDAAFAAMELLHRAGKIFEINTGAISRGYRTSPYPEAALLRHLASLGGRICISSDAHSADAIACGFAESEALALACGFDALWEFDGQGFRPRHIL